MPVLAALGTRPLWTAVIGAAATLVALASGALIGDGLDRDDGIRAIAVALTANVAVWASVLRFRLEDAYGELRTGSARLEALLDALAEAGEGIVVLEHERAVYVNDAMLGLTGRSESDLIALESIFEVVDPLDRDEARRRARQRFRSDGADPDYRLCLARPDGSRIDVEVSAVPLRDKSADQLVVLVRDVTDRQRELRRSDFLAEASAVFAEDLDEGGTLERIARLCVRDLAEVCVVVTLDGGQGLQRALAFARDGERQALLDSFYARAGANTRGDGEPLVVSARSGRPITIEDLPAAVKEMGSPERLELVDQLDLRTAVIVPLAARGRTHGAMALGFGALTPNELAHMTRLFGDVATRGALALDNARLYGERAHVARTLQRSLLPSELPEVPGLELAAFYSPAGNEVGGDFYDCFAGLGDEWVLVMGDVCGKGPEAAAVTAIARYTLRTSVLHGGGPVEALQELNEVLLRQDLDGRFCTVCCAMLQPAGENLCVRFASGGHPLPLVRTPQGTRAVGRPGTLLGILPYPRLQEDETVLHPGDGFILFTDGVIEASPRDGALGPDQLVDFVAARPEVSAAGIGAAIQREALRLQDGVARDDIAILAARRLPTGADGVSG